VEASIGNRASAAFSAFDGLTPRLSQTEKRIPFFSPFRERRFETSLVALKTWNS